MRESSRQGERSLHLEVARSSKRTTMEEKQHNDKLPRIVKMGKGEKGYGFNLHGERGVVGQYISAVDNGGPAQKAGLCVGDRVIEVNGINVEAATHSQVVAKIKEGADETVLLVVDKVTDDYLKQHNIAVTAELAKKGDVQVEVSAEESTQPDGVVSDGAAEKVEDSEPKGDEEVEEVGMSIEDYLKLHGEVEDKPVVAQQEVTGNDAVGKEEAAAAVEATPAADETQDVAQAEDTAQTQYAEQAQDTVQTQADTPSEDAVEEKPKAEVVTEQATPVVVEKEAPQKVKMTPPEEPPPTPPADQVDAPKQPEPVKVEKTAEKVEEKAPEVTLLPDPVLKKSAALPKPKRKEIKEKKGTDWASRAAIFNNL